VTGPSAFLILADEAAAWRVAGLSLLDRLALALNENAERESPNEILQVFIFWHPDVPAAKRWLPRHPRISRVRFSEAIKSVPAAAVILHARLFVQRTGLSEFFRTTALVRDHSAPEETIAAWNNLSSRFKAILPRPGARSWRYIENSSDVEICEKAFLNGMGKSQDGIVSRFLNRPISRLVSRYLLRFDLIPTQWTLGLFILPVIAFLCLCQGGYPAIVTGALLFQIYSILDGCDGEIARATYQESERGGRIDDFLDMIGSMLFVCGLGIGLFQARSSIFLLEGIVCAAVIGANEWFLRRVTIEDRPESEVLTDALYPRHRRLLAQPPLGAIGQDTWWWIIQFTKRDTAILLFLVLAVLDQAQWILHLWLIVSATTLILSARSNSSQSRSIQPGA
jgi:hypothetical protein